MDKENLDLLKQEQPPISFLFLILSVLHEEDLIRIRKRLEKKDFKDVANFLSIELKARKRAEK
jgi:hypothetical protein